LKISSYSFKNPNLFPPLRTHQGDGMVIEVDKRKFRINANYDLLARKQGAPSATYFWFRLTGKHLYYSENKDTVNILDNIVIKHIKVAFPHSVSKKNFCFQIKDVTRRKFKICAKTLADRNRWVCLIQKNLGLKQDRVCKGKAQRGKASQPVNAKIVVKKIIQPELIIPMPSRTCNDRWDYVSKGVNWECECKEGTEQSPINLPPPKKAISSAIKPLFEYYIVSPISPANFKDGLVRKGESIKIRLIDHALRIFHPNMGKIVTLDGSTYVAQEIVFHTPSEHTINGKRYDMEMQVIHTGVTQGDIAKNAILSVLFQKKAGAYNKLLDKIDPFNLPDPMENYREIINNLYIPDVFSLTSDKDTPIMKPFSFYTYQGSLTQPPCSERTTVYVASKPVFLSSSTLELFKESLKMPDKVDEYGNVQVANYEPLNYRQVQNQNGRAIFHFDDVKECGPRLFEVNKRIKPKGHYEKKINEMAEYFYVNGPHPSGMPGALVVSKQEALGLPTGLQAKKAK